MKIILKVIYVSPSQTAFKLAAKRNTKGRKPFVDSCSWHNACEGRPTLLLIADPMSEFRTDRFPAIVLNGRMIYGR